MIFSIVTNVNFFINFKPWRCCNHRIRAQSDQIVKQIFLDCRGLWKCKDKDLDWSEASVDGRSVGSVWGNAVSAVGKKSILVFWSQIHLKIPCQPTGTWQICENQYKSDRGREKNHPVAGQGSTRSQNSRQIEFSSRNGREISSSVYGTTRCPQL